MVWRYIEQDDDGQKKCPELERVKQHRNSVECALRGLMVRRCRYDESEFVATEPFGNCKGVVQTRVGQGSRTTLHPSTRSIPTCCSCCSSGAIADADPS